eukprot:gene18634-21205_t
MSDRADPSQIAALQRGQRNIRNFCILAHVDHGKTTLSDSLVSSNGIISAKLAGKLRYLDSTEEEQKRGITMHSSAISLLFRNEEKGADTAAGAEAPKPEEFLINLIDSPGHIDFSSDVSTATRLCDGALLVVDVLEGICTQTHAVVYKALKERMRPCLVLNKIDRLFIDMKLSSTEAFQHLKRLLEQVNALAYTLLKSEVLKRENISEELAAKLNKTNNTGLNASHGLDEEIEDDPLFQEWNFEPEKGNVIFCSALDCWGFGTAKFANIWSKRLGVNRNVLRKYLFEDYAFNPTTKKIVKIDTSRGGSGNEKPMFASMVLDPLWQLYEAALVEQDATKAANMANKGFGVVLPPREINPRDTRATLQAILRRWLPLSDAVLRMIIRTVPDPIAAQQSRLFTLMPGVIEPIFDLTDKNTTEKKEVITLSEEELTAQKTKDYSAVKLPVETAALARSPELLEEITQSYEGVKNCVSRCDHSAEAPVVVFVSKMVPVKVAELSARDVAALRAHLTKVETDKYAGQESTPESAAEIAAAVAAQTRFDSEVFIALARVFSGVLKRDSALYVLGSKYDPLTEPLPPVPVTSHQNSSTTEGSAAAMASFNGLTPLPADTSLGLYIMLGPSVTPVEEVPAGNIVGILGLSELVLKTATLSSTWATYPMNSITFQSKPMLKVAVEPTSHVDLRSLEHGLQLLHQFDPVVEVGVDRDTGQNTMTCLGELHLEQCVKALVERFAKCQVNVSEPLIAFRESVLSAEAGLEGQSNHSKNTSTLPLLPPPWSEISELAQARGGRFRVVFGSGNVAMTIRCFPLHEAMTKLLEESGSKMEEVNVQQAEVHRQLQSCRDSTAFSECCSALGAAQGKFWTDFAASTKPTADSPDTEAVDVCLREEGTAGDSIGSSALRSRVLSIGSTIHATNLLLLSAEAHVSVWSNAIPLNAKTELGGNAIAVEASLTSAVLGDIAVAESPAVFHRLWARLHSACTAAFRLAVESGPLMREPLHGVGFVIEHVEVNAAVCNSVLTPQERAVVYESAAERDLSASALSINSGAESVASSSDFSTSSASILTGQLISELKDALHVCMLSLPVRIVEPVYKCDLQCDQSQLGNLYAVLSQRRGSVTNEDIIEGTSLFLLSADLPVHSSFGFAQQLLKKTSGLGTAPQLSFSHWSRIDTDPFWRPTTEDELEEYGEQGLMTGAERNLPRGIIDAVRKRKGLPIEEKIVKSAEKQRTLNKKK